MSLEIPNARAALNRTRGAARSCPSHEWRLVSDDVDEFGPVRMYECTNCGRVHFS